jgi:hypothetical protein
MPWDKNPSPKDGLDFKSVTFASDNKLIFEHSHRQKSS